MESLLNSRTVSSGLFWRRNEALYLRNLCLKEKQLSFLAWKVLRVAKLVEAWYISRLTRLLGFHLIHSSIFDSVISSQPYLVILN